NYHVVAGLADRGVDVEQPGLVEAKYPQRPRQSLADDRNVCRRGGQHEPELWGCAHVRSRLHAEAHRFFYGCRCDRGRAIGLVMALPPFWVAETIPCSWLAAV